MFKRVRFVINVNDVDRQVVAVSESAEGNLSIIPYVGDLTDHPKGEFPTDTTKTSVHVSPSSPGYLIKHYVGYSHGDHVDHAVFVEDGKKRFLWPIGSRVVSSRDNDRYIRQAKSKDRVISLGAYDVTFSTLAYLILASDTKTDIPEHIYARHQRLTNSYLDNKFRTYTHRFSVFQITVIPFFFHVHSMPSGSGVIYGHQKERWNDEDLERSTHSNRSISTNDIPDFLEFGAEPLKPKILHYISRYTGLTDLGPIPLAVDRIFPLCFQERKKIIQQF